MGQAFQAWACGIEPTADMNPVLVKPLGGGRMQVMLRGEPFMYVGPGTLMPKDEVMDRVCESYDLLCRDYDRVVCEGSGSPVELNLMEADMANIGLMRARGVPAVLIGDIERGGVFAAVYGTWLLMPEDVRPLMRGFVINRFRGDASILGSGIKKVEGLTGMECLGIVPYNHLRFPEEDSLSSKGGRIGSGSIQEGFVRNLDELISSAEETGLDFSRFDEISSARGDPDCFNHDPIADGRIHRDRHPIHYEYERLRVETRAACRLGRCGSRRRFPPLPLAFEPEAHSPITSPAGRFIPPEGIRPINRLVAVRCA